MLSIQFLLLLILPILKNTLRYPCLRLQFGGVPKGAGYRVPYVRNHSWRNGVGRNNGPYTRSTPRFPSPTLTAQRFIREQQSILLHCKLTEKKIC
uniref:Secreted protein n=1 Tax=Helianthus annuus TaxID=4232 RepID=A0A251SWJ5_HELAN